MTLQFWACTQVKFVEWRLYGILEVCLAGRASFTLLQASWECASTFLSLNPQLDFMTNN